MTPLEWFLAACASVSLMTLVLTIRNLRMYMPPPEADPREDALVSVCIPCRNEEHNIEHVVSSVLSSEYANLEVLVYDDESTDHTGEILLHLTEEDARVRLVESVSLPARWVGKQHACHRLAASAKGAWLLFLDADVRLEPDAIGRALTFAREKQVKLASTFPRQITKSLGEQLVVPMIFFLLIGYLPFKSMRKTLAPSASAACGQFMLVEREAYSSSGGHAAISDSMHDGVKLPRLFRRAGHRTDIFDGTALCRVRMYNGFAQTWLGFTKNAYEGLGTPGLLILLTVLHLSVHIAPWIMLPVLLATSAPALATLFATMTILLQITQRLLLLTRFEHSPVLAILHPISITLLTMIQWRSYADHRNASRSWKGRTMGESLSEELVVLVDENDRELGTMEKQAAHVGGGALHRAFSVFVFDENNRLMLQKRAGTKYHFAGLWTNTCCSHPRPGESPLAGAERRLQEEMGLTLPLEPRGTFVYKASDETSGLTEHELDHVFVGRTSNEPVLNTDEAEDWRWITLDELAQELEASPENFTPWFPIALYEVSEFGDAVSRVSHKHNVAR